MFKSIDKRDKIVLVVIGILVFLLGFQLGVLYVRDTYKRPIIFSFPKD